MVSACALEDCQVAMIAANPSRKPTRPKTCRRRKNSFPCAMALSFYGFSGRFPDRDIQLLVSALAPAQAVTFFEGVHGWETHQLIHFGERQHGSWAAYADPFGFQMAVDNL